MTDLDLEIVDRLTLLRVKPGDTLVVHVSELSSHAEIDSTVQAWKPVAMLLGAKVVVTKNVDHFSVIRQGKAT